MENGEHDELSGPQTKENGVGKALHPGTPDIAKDERKLQGRLAGPRQGSGDLEDEFLPKSGSLLLIPVGGFVVLEAGSLAKVGIQPYFAHRAKLAV